ncbi:hypothetical protein PTSG_11060 [Salpingoeca rosetta]|uniref:Ribosomal protein/NADH dehydrogenase domain-containing protein n=1 Tax=Salpingoeca rosetta (strain ATCC 50818 / BSB-021) TaxID=946362 RepID=F2US10_SALR5|nr:uncharacterized protein PTSG_11060 [Salpingoeca rosetta]EGD80415.1 hypothetical protein PTSG_11060 [Salpingoeca rosetta]|eukprot:XP_004987979.1 hypothetical protein PTSG_11060 [Salpingoeca rosetta]
MSLGRVVRELRIHLCSASPASQGARDFVTKYYSSLKKANPSLPVLVRECNGAQAQVQARLPFGEEKHFAVNGMSAEEIKSVIDGLAK